MNTQNKIEVTAKCLPTNTVRTHFEYFKNASDAIARCVKLNNQKLELFSVTAKIVQYN